MGIDWPEAGLGIVVQPSDSAIDSEPSLANPGPALAAIHTGRLWSGLKTWSH